MVSPAKKRRSRSKTQYLVAVPRSSKKKKKQESPWVSQCWSIVLATVSLFLALSLVFGRLSVALSSGEKFSNMLGPAGHFLGTLLFGSMGWCALVPILWLSWLSVMVWRREISFKALESSWLLIGVGFLGVWFFSCSLGSVLFGVKGGGSIGMVTARPLLSLFNTLGALIFSFAFLLLSMSLAMGVGVSRLGAGMFRVSLWIGRGFVITLPLWLMAAVRGVADYSLRMLRCFADQVKSAYTALLNALSRFKDMLSSIIRQQKERGGVTQGRVNAPDVKSVKAGEDDSGEPLKNKSVLIRRPVKKPGTQVSRKKAMARCKDDSVGEQYYTGTYTPPSLDLLVKAKNVTGREGDRQLKLKSVQIEKKLKDFNISGRITEVHPGPVITLFEFEPAAGVKVQRIVSLADDLAMTLKAVSIRIIAPIPGKGTVGIEVPNAKREWVRLRELLETREFIEAESVLSVCIGKDTYGHVMLGDISRMPHLLIAGATGTGKSVCINAILLSLLYRATPAELGLILIDPKILELSIYEGIPHLRVPVVTSPKQAKAVLEWAINEMNRRYRLMQKLGVRSLDGYNQVVKGEDESYVTDGFVSESFRSPVQEMIEDGTGHEEEEERGGEDSGKGGIVEVLRPLPKIVIVVDELADLMLSVGRDIEDLVTRLAQKARAAGIHLIVATQRPSVDVITGLIKANFPARMSFQVSSRIDSRTIIDGAGAEKLLGRGDMLFMPPGVGSLTRVHGAFVSDSEVKKVVSAIKDGCTPNYDQEILEVCQKALEEDAAKGGGSSDGDDGYDALYDQALAIVLDKGQASTSMVQRHLRIGYNRAARIIDTMERDGVIGPADGAKPREVLLRGNE